MEDWCTALDRGDTDAGWDLFVSRYHRLVFATIPAELMDEFYRHYVTGADPAQALAMAQRAFLAARPNAHPFHWAGFVAVRGSSQ